MRLRYLLLLSLLWGAQASAQSPFVFGDPVHLADCYTITATGERCCGGVCTSSSSSSSGGGSSSSGGGSSSSGGGSSSSGGSTGGGIIAGITGGTGGLLDPCVDAGICEKPDASNTGPEEGESLTANTVPYNLDEDGRTYSNFTMGCIRIRASNITIENALITGEVGCTYGIDIANTPSGATVNNITIRHVEIRGGNSGGIKGSSSHGSLHLYKVKVHQNRADALKLYSNTTVQRSYITDVGTTAGAHADGIQIPVGTNVLIAGNNFDQLKGEGYINTQCMLMKTDNGPISYISVRRNWVRGAGICIQFRDHTDGPHGAPTNYEVLHNISGCGHQDKVWQLDGSPVQQNNFYDNSALCTSEATAGQPIPANGG